jgi:hypothetical protein
MVSVMGLDPDYQCRLMPILNIRHETKRWLKREALSRNSGASDTLLANAPASLKPARGLFHTPRPGGSIAVA